MITTAIGYDVCIEILEQSYTIQHDDLGQAFGFSMDDPTRETLHQGIVRVFPNQRDIERVDIEPGYVRVRVEPARARETTPERYVTALGDLADWYNEHHARKAEIDGLQTGDTYVNVYRPESATDPGTFVDRITGDDRTPDTGDGPIWSLTRDGHPSQMPDRHLAYRVIVPFDPAMYETTRERRHAFEWGDFERERIQEVAEDLPLWPGGADAVQELSVHPEYVSVEVHWGHIKATPGSVGGSIRRALDRYNQMVGTHPRLSTDHKQVLPPDLMFGAKNYVAGLAVDDRTVDDWIASRGLEGIDGHPVEPEPEVEETETSGGLLPWR